MTSSLVKGARQKQAYRYKQQFSKYNVNIRKPRETGSIKQNVCFWDVTE